MNQIKIIYKYSIIADIFGIISLLAKNGLDDHPFGEKMKGEYLNSLNRLKELEIFSYGLVELFIAIDPFDAHNFINSLKKMDTIDFLFYLLEQDLSKEDIKKSMKDNGVFLEYCSQNEYLSKDYYERYLKVIKNPEVYKKDLISLIELLLVDYTSEEEKHKDFKVKIMNELKEKVPLQVSQELMGKNFKRVSDYNEYIFISTFYSPTTCIRVFNDQKLITIKNIKEKKQNISLNKINKFLKILSDPKRLEIIRFISNEASYGIELSEKFAISRPTVSHHLEQLRELNLVNVERVKNTKYYSLNKKSFDKYIKSLNDYINKK